jgi:hypothetical protein
MSNSVNDIFLTMLNTFSEGGVISEAIRKAVFEGNLFFCEI